MFLAALLMSYVACGLADAVLCRIVNRLRLSVWQERALKAGVHSGLLTPFLFGTKATHGIGVFPLIAVIWLETAAPTSVIVRTVAGSFTVFLLAYAIGAWINKIRRG